MSDYGSDKNELSIEIEQEENDEEEKKTFRQKVDNYLSQKNKKQIIEILSAAFSMSTFVIYIASTYFDAQTFIWFIYIDFIVCFYFIMEILLHLFLAQHRFMYIIKLDTIIDIFTSTMPLLYFIDSHVVKKIIECAWTFRIIRISRFMNKSVKNNENEVAKQISIMILSALTLILIFTLVYRVVEIDQIKIYLFVLRNKLINYF